MKDVKVVCPFDRIESDVPDGNIKFLKKNFTILEAIQELQYKNTTDETEEDSEYEAEKAVGIPCDEDPSHLAVLFCTACKVNLCSRCSILSHSSKIFKSHKIVKVTEKPEPLLMCPLHEYNVAELYCHDKECEIGSKIMCLNCHLYGVHKGHDHQFVEEVFEAKKNEAFELLKKTNSKKVRAKFDVDSFGMLPDRVENDQDFINVKKHIDGTYASYLSALNNWKKSNLEMLTQKVEEKIENRKKEKELHDSQMKELESISNKFLQVTNQGKAEYFEKSADFETATTQLKRIKIEKPAKRIEIKSLIKPPSLCESMFCETYKPIRKIVVLVRRQAILEIIQENWKNLLGFKEITCNSFRMEDRHGNPCYIQFWNKETFEKSPVHLLENTTFIILYMHELCLKKMTELSKDAKIVLSWSKKDLLDSRNYNARRNMWAQISAPIFLSNWDDIIFEENVCKGNYENNPYFERLTDDREME